jgi:hypothetical protein
MPQMSPSEIIAQREREAAEQKAQRKRGRGNKRTRRGRPAFVPSSSERRFVQAMAGLRMSADEICKVVGGGRARDTDSGKPISKTTLFRHFKTELASGRAMLKARVAGKFYMRSTRTSRGRSRWRCAISSDGTPVVAASMGRSSLMSGSRSRRRSPLWFPAGLDRQRKVYRTRLRRRSLGSGRCLSR